MAFCPPQMIEGPGELVTPVYSQFQPKPCGATIEIPSSMQAALARATSQRAQSMKQVYGPPPDCQRHCRFLSSDWQYYSDLLEGNDCSTFPYRPAYHYRREVQRWDCSMPNVPTPNSIYHFCKGWDSYGCVTRASIEPPCPEPRCDRS